MSLGDSQMRHGQVNLDKLMIQLKNKKLILFFTFGVSLKIWNDVGILDREIEMYKRLSRYLRGIYFLSYGNESELAFLKKLSGIKLLHNRWRFKSILFSLLAPLLYWREMKEATFFKTNQINGSWTAIIAKFFFGKKLVVRCGYLPSLLYRRKRGENRYKGRIASLLEPLAFRAADKIILTTEEIQKYVIDRYGVEENKVTVVPNFVNTDVFKHLPEIKKEESRICFIGRLSEEKNVFSLLDALKDMKDIKLVIIGDGPLRKKLEEKVKEDRINANFLGNIPNHQLPIQLNKSELFILPSIHEGHPKALLEAMACELPVIGTDVPGIKEVITHKENGYLCGTSSKEIRKAIIEVLKNDRLKAKMGKKGREFVTKTCSVEKILEQELKILGELAK